jgi:hypothetical protein
VDPKTGLPFYLGKGKGDRAYIPFRNPRVTNKYNKLINEGYVNNEIIHIRISNLEEDEAYKKETELIAKYGIVDEGGCLLNFRKDGQNANSYAKLRGRVIDDIISLYTVTKLNMKEIGELYEVHETTIRSILIKNKIDIRPQGFTTPGKVEILNNKERFFDLYVNQKITLKAISNMLNCSIPVVIDAFNQVGIPIRKRNKSVRR